MDLGSLVSIIGIIAGVILLLPVLIGGVFVILVVSNRADVDPTGRRPAVVYLLAVSFITLFVTLFSTFVVVAQLCSLIGTTNRGTAAPVPAILGGLGSGGGVITPVRHPVGDAVARAVVIAALLAIVAGAMYVMHLRAGQRGTAGVAFGDPAGRVRSSYVAAVSFVCVVILVVATVAGVFQIFRIAGPGVFNSGATGNRTDAFRTLLPLAYLVAATFYLLRRHAGELPAQVRPMLPGRFAAPPPPADETGA
jgi:hypothetical protein